MVDPSSTQNSNNEKENNENKNNDCVIDYFEKMSHENDVDDLEEEQEWQGFEVQMVADDDAELFEDEITGMRFKFNLTPEDLYNTLSFQNTFKTQGTRAIIESIILGIAVILFSASFIYSNFASIRDLLLAIISILVIVAIWIVPPITLKKRANELYNNKEIEVVVYPDEIQIGKGNGQWQIPLDNTSTYQEYKDLILITTPKKTVVAFPIRCIEPSALGEIQAMLMAGTIIIASKTRKD